MSTPGARARRTARATGLLVAAFLLTACGAASGQGGDQGSAAQEPGEPTHTMADGSVMDGSTHEEHGGDHGGDHGSHGSSVAGPSEVATMICGGQVGEDVGRIMGVEGELEPTSTWEEPVFTCTFDLPEGPIVLRVHDATDEQAGQAYFEGLQAGDRQAEPLRGLLGLGLPAFTTDRGTAVFIREGKTLEVDATGLPRGPVSATGDQDRRDVAYEVASSVLACWTAHS